MATRKDDHLQTIQEASDELEKHETKTLKIRQDRDNKIRVAIKDNVTMYAISKQIGISEAAVAKIRDNN